MVYENTHNFHVIFLINKRLWVKYVRQGIVFVHNPIYIQMSSLHNLHKSFCTHKNCNHHIWLTHGMQTPRPQRCLLAQIQGLDGTNSSRLPSGNHQSLPFCSSLKCADWVSLCQPQHAGLLPPCPHSHSVIKHIIEYYKVITRLLSWISTCMYLLTQSMTAKFIHMSYVMSPKWIRFGR